MVNFDHPENLDFEPAKALLSANKFTINNHKIEPTAHPKNETIELTEERQPNSAFEFDKLDLTIMDMLSKNARLSFRKIAAQIGISTQKVITRYDKLKKVMPFSFLTISLRKIGYMGIAILLITVSNRHVTSKVFEEILQVPNVIIAFRTIGPWQITVGIPFYNLDQLLESHHKITRISGVTGAEMLLHKPYPSWPLNLFSPLISKCFEQLNR